MSRARSVAVPQLNQGTLNVRMNEGVKEEEDEDDDDGDGGPR